MSIPYFPLYCRARLVTESIGLFLFVLLWVAFFFFFERSFFKPQNFTTIILTEIKSCRQKMNVYTI